MTDGSIRAIDTVIPLPQWSHSREPTGLAGWRLRGAAGGGVQAWKFDSAELPHIRLVLDPSDAAFKFNEVAETAAAKSSTWRSVRDDGLLALLEARVPVPPLHESSVASGEAPTAKLDSGALDLEALLRSAESAELEFKSSLRWSYKTSQFAEQVTQTAVKTIAAFLNSEGGILVIGVSDTAEVLGLEPDGFLREGGFDPDGWLRHFTNKVAAAIGNGHWARIRVSWGVRDSKSVAVISVGKSPVPVFATFEQTEFFFVRRANSTAALTSRELLEHLGQAWKR